MPNELPPPITRLLLNWSGGDDSALADLMPLVCDDLRMMARRYLHRESSNDVQATELVNEFFLRLAARNQVSWKNRAHFFGFAGQTMRLILVDQARKRNRLKHGGGDAPIALGWDLELLPDKTQGADILALHDALERLERLDERAGTVVKLRFFVGMSVDETAAALEVSKATVKRDWEFARLWLYRALSGGSSTPPAEAEPDQDETPAADEVVAESSE